VAGTETVGRRVGAGIAVVGGEVETAFVGDEVDVTTMTVVGLSVGSGAVVLSVGDCTGGEKSWRMQR